jgi:ankyrin repeat protein
MYISIKTLKKSNMEPYKKQECYNFLHIGPYPAMNEGIRPKTEIEFDLNTSENQLSVACCQGKFGVVESLIEKGYDINQKDQANLTPIMCAATNGHKNIVKLLVNYGAKISYQLLCLIKEKIDNLEEEAKKGKEDPYIVVNWMNFLDYLIQEGKRQA